MRYLTLGARHLNLLEEREKAGFFLSCFISSLFGKFFRVSSARRLVSFFFFCFLSSGCHAAELSRVCFKDSCYTVDVVSTPDERERGLMFRDGMPPGHGMFFIFDQSGEYAFWMKNMAFPIDMLWLDEGKTIVHAEQNVPPCKTDPCSVYSPGAQARYVLEIPAGDSRRLNFINGQKADFSFPARESK